MSTEGQQASRSELCDIRLTANDGKYIHLNSELKYFYFEYFCCVTLVLHLIHISSTKNNQQINDDSVSVRLLILKLPAVCKVKNK